MVAVDRGATTAYFGRCHEKLLRATLNGAIIRYAPLKRFYVTQKRILHHNRKNMPKTVSQNELEAVFSAVARFHEGASLEEIGEALGNKLFRRTLQRRLALLLDQKRIYRKGQGRASRYCVQTISRSLDAAIPAIDIQAHGERYIPISPEGQIIKEAVRAPMTRRNPVGYQRAFLDAYRPDHTHYLGPEIRKYLFECGQVTDGKLPAGTYARQICNRLLIDLSWNSSRLEGNTYSLLDTERLIERGEATEGKDAFETQMILNHKAAIELLVDQAAEIGFNAYTIRNLHALLSDNLLPDPQACGRVRAIPVAIAGTVYHPLDLPQRIAECFQQVLEIASAISDPFEQAFFAMMHLPYLQPFEDVNKRVSRLATLSFVDVPEPAYVDGILGVYELNRVELLRDVFIWAYERSCARYATVRQSLGEPDPFRLRHRASIGEVVSAAVEGCMDKKSAAAFVKRRAAEMVPQQDRARFIEMAETELMSLNEGNIARFRLRPTQYQAWLKTWR
jgi:hypothetical protein